MSLTDLAALGSFVSGLAVVFSFVFLGLQIRQSNRNQKSLMQQGRSTRNVEILSLTTNPFMSGVLADALNNPAALAPEKVVAFYGFAAAMFWSYEDSFLQFRSNMLDATSWTSDMATIRRLLQYPAYRTVWKMARDGMAGPYREFIDGVMHEARADATETLNDRWKMFANEELSRRAGRPLSPPKESP